MSVLFSYSIEAGINTLRLDLEKKMNHRWEYIEGKISALDAKVSMSDNHLATETEAMKQLTKEAQNNVREMRVDE